MSSKSPSSITITPEAKERLVKHSFVEIYFWIRRPITIIVFFLF